MSCNFRDLIIFEMANNHQGDVKLGLRIIEEMAQIARKFNIRAAVKLQYRDLDSFIHSSYQKCSEPKHIKRFLQTRLRWEELQSLVLATKDRGMTSVITCFDENSIEHALDHGVDILKIASTSCLDWPLLGEVVKTRKPLICSTGGCGLADIDRLANFLEHRNVSDVALLHCVGIYPTADADQQLLFMRRMMMRYPNCTIGYSGHEDPDNLRIAVAAIAMGAQILERHVGIPTDTVTLNSYSMNPDQAARWVAEVVAARAICGKEGDKAIREVEEASLRSLARGVWAARQIMKGEAIPRTAVFFAMPLQPSQTSAREYLENMVASKDYYSGEPIQEVRDYDPIFAMRSVVHEAKALLREAHIVPGANYQIELSHHYGLESFRRFGATIVNIINREYCKKLVIMLPGQTHPSHAHVKKEESFQVLYGELSLVLDGQSCVMNPGDIRLVERGVYHSFTTTGGCIFEEISTTHIKGDSIYEDERIARLDPVLRKTVTESW